MELKLGYIVKLLFYYCPTIKNYIIMKKYFIIQVALLSFLFLASCGKDDDNSDDTATTTYPVPVIITDTQNTSTSNKAANPENNMISVFDNRFANLLNRLNASESVVTTYEYDDRAITKITIDMDTLINIAGFYYKDQSKGLLDSIVYTSDQVFAGVDNIH